MSGRIGDLLDAGRIDTATLSVAPGPSEVATLVDRPRTAMARLTSPPTTLSSLAHSQRLHERRCARRTLRPRYRFPEGMSCDMDIII